MSQQDDALGVTGYHRLWNWFGLSRASFLTLPRVLMHEMPDDWQGRMAKLLEEYNEAFPNDWNGIDSTRVQAMNKGKLVRWPEWIPNYRHPDKEAIAQLRPSEPSPNSTSPSTPH